MSDLGEAWKNYQNYAYLYDFKKKISKCSDTQKEELLQYFMNEQFESSEDALISVLTMKITDINKEFRKEFMKITDKKIKDNATNEIEKKYSTTYKYFSNNNQTKFIT
eukprot:387788_1